VNKESLLSFPSTLQQKETQLKRWDKPIVSDIVITNNIVDTSSVGFAVDEIMKKVFKRKDLIMTRSRFKNF
jgi:hypothetical protein